MSILQADGIQFGSDNTTLDSRYGIIPQNSVTVFFESAAPTYWTKLTTHNNKALRVVSGTGGGFGSGGTSGPGGSPFTSIFNTIPVSGTVTSGGSVGGHTLSVAELPSHNHGSGSSVSVRPGAGVNARALNANAPDGESVGGSQPHNHPFVPAPVPWSANVNLAVQYIDIILCRFSG
jgi:hypothetical protein